MSKTRLVVVWMSDSGWRTRCRLAIVPMRCTFAFVKRSSTGWGSATELGDFADRRASAEDRDWRSLDPRLDDPADAEDAGDETGE